MVNAREPPIVPVTEPQLAALLGQVGGFVPAIVRASECKYPVVAGAIASVEAAWFYLNQSRRALDPGWPMPTVDPPDCSTSQPDRNRDSYGIVLQLFSPP